MMENYRLYGGEVSYYTGKARAYLRHKGIPFEEVLSTREVYKKIILPRVGWPVVPVVVTPEDDTLQDTTEIIDALEARFPEPSVYPSTPRQRLAALLLEVYGDEWLLLPAMHYRWKYCYDWILLQFGQLSRPDLSEEEQRAVGERTAGPFHGSLPFLGVSEETTGAIEVSYRELLADLEAHFQSHPFLLGARPSIGDFGLIGPLYAHLYRDPYPGELMRREAPNVARWVERMQDPGLKAGSSEESRDRPPPDGDFLPDDTVPESLFPVLERMFAEQVPVLLDTIKRLSTWLDDNPDDEIPRTVGQHRFTLLAGTREEVTSTRAVFPYAQWMFQRPVDYYQSLEGSDRARCDELLEAVGGGDALCVSIRGRVKRENFRLVRE